MLPESSSTLISEVTVSQTDKYIRAATRDSTRKSYAAAMKHYEEDWGGFLPATADSVASYLAHYATSLALSTLKQRIAAISVWHTQQGFPDPTKAPHVKKVLKGIAQVHPYRQKQAEPLQLDHLTKIDRYITQLLSEKSEANTSVLKLLRDKSLILLGFWRAFRSDELTNLRIENIRIVENQGMEIYIPHSKTDRDSKGVIFRVPALSTLCPVAAYRDWIAASQLTSGPAFPQISRWSHIGEEGLSSVSIRKFIKFYCHCAGIDKSKNFSSHSLRRGFASWANAYGWNLKDLMEYVGWKDINSAIRYIDNPDPFSKGRIENALNIREKEYVALPDKLSIELEVHLSIERYSKHTKGVSTTRNTIESYCLKDLQMRCFNGDKSRYEITIAYRNDTDLDETIDDLLHQMHEIAQRNKCILEVMIRDKGNHRVWE